MNRAGTAVVAAYLLVGLVACPAFSAPERRER